MKSCKDKDAMEFAKCLAREFCAKNGLDVRLLDLQSVYSINDSIIFAQPSSVKPQGLQNDLITQPVPTLIAEKTTDGYQIKTTEYTYGILGNVILK